MLGVRHWFFRFRTRLPSVRCLAASACRHARSGRLVFWLVRSPASFPCLGCSPGWEITRWRWRFCPLWESHDVLCGVHCGLLALWLGGQCGGRGCIACRLHNLSGVAF